MHGGWCSPETLNREPRRLGSMFCLRHRQLPPLLGGVLSSQLRASVVLLDIGWYFCKIRCCFFFMRQLPEIKMLSELLVTSQSNRVLLSALG